jgi:hypothetical protein
VSGIPDTHQQFSCPRVMPADHILPSAPSKKNCRGVTSGQAYGPKQDAGRSNEKVFLISNFRRVQYVVCFLLGNSPVSEFYIPTFRNTLFHLHRQVGISSISSINLLAYEDGTECSETSAYKIQTPGNYPEENIQRESSLQELTLYGFCS